MCQKMQSTNQPTKFSLWWNKMGITPSWASCALNSTITVFLHDSIKYPTKVKKPLNKETKPNQTIQPVTASVLLYGNTPWILTKHLEKKPDDHCSKIVRVFLTIPGSSTPQNISCTTTYLPSHNLSKKEVDILDTDKEAMSNSQSDVL